MSKEYGGNVPYVWKEHGEVCVILTLGHWYGCRAEANMLIACAGTAMYR